MNFKFLSSKDKKRIIAELSETYGIEKMPWLLVETGKEKIRAFSGSMSREEIVELSEIANIEVVGVYIIKREFERTLQNRSKFSARTQRTSSLIPQLYELKCLKRQNLAISEAANFAPMFIQTSLERLRLGFDGAGILKEQIKKNIIEIDDEQLEKWMNGWNLDVEMEKGLYVVRRGDDFLGCGISDGKKIINFVPKERRIRRSQEKSI